MHLSVSAHLLSVRAGCNAMVTKPKIPTTKEWPGDLGQPIVVQFRGMPGSTTWWWDAPDNPQGKNEPKDDFLAEVEKLNQKLNQLGVAPVTYLYVAERVEKLNQLGLAPVAGLDGLAERVEKLSRLADHYGIDRSGDPGWGLLLAYQLACDLHHPGFELVYDHWTATVFKNLFGFTPLHPTKEGDSPRHRPKGAGAWAPEFAPELVALLVDMTRRRSQ
jgi:hypothetical protein